MNLISHSLILFWNRHPALLYGIACMLGACLTMTYQWPFIIMVSLLCIILPLLKNLRNLRIFLALILGCCSFFLAQVNYHFPSSQTLEGLAEIEFSSLSSTKMPFGTIWVYQGNLLSLLDPKTGKLLAKNLPFHLILPKNSITDRPSTTYRYRLLATLKNKGQFHYTLIPSKGAFWETLKKKWSLSEWRISVKKDFQRQISQAIKDSHVAAFLSGIATGEFDDPELSIELGRFGLQHLMAVSGLHFSILASILTSFLGLILGFCYSQRVAALITLLLLSGYFIFLGYSVSVLRAWIAITLVLAGPFAKRHSLALNSLGVALLVVALFDPLLIGQVAFQLSFGITAAILLWFRPCDQLLQKLFPKRTLNQVVDIGWLNQHGYCLLVFLRQALALSLAVNLVALPLTLYYFHQFPLMSLAYNLFFPFLVSFSMLLLLLACFASLLSETISQLVYSINESYTKFLLNFAFKLPKELDTIWYFTSLSESILLSYLIIIFLLGIFLKTRFERLDSPNWIL